MADAIYQNLLRFLRYESKDTTYKFALLLGLIEISSESLHFIERPTDENSKLSPATA